METEISAARWAMWLGKEFTFLQLFGNLKVLLMLCVLVYDKAAYYIIVPICDLC